MKEFVVTYSITGRATAVVEAEDMQEALAKAKQLDCEAGDLLEWSFDEVENVEEE